MADGNTFAALLPVALSALAVGAILSEPLPVPAQFIGEVTGNAEQDTYGADLSGQESEAPAPRYSQTARYIGWLTDDPEKDTYGFVVLRLDDGAGPIAAAK